MSRSIYQVTKIAYLAAQLDIHLYFNLLGRKPFLWWESGCLLPRRCGCCSAEWCCAEKTPSLSRCPSRSLQVLSVSLNTALISISSRRIILPSALLTCWGKIKINWIAEKRIRMEAGRRRVGGARPWACSDEECVCGCVCVCTLTECPLVEDLGHVECFKLHTSVRNACCFAEVCLH